jgi:hypothetical protein
MVSDEKIKRNEITFFPRRQMAISKESISDLPALSLCFTSAIFTFEYHKLLVFE